ncbi:hypothetical protein SNEBB_010108 [Seison nebaliae]|nr:hypothetical protein SNEBB_010108 [Seison nebaliae]
MNELEEVIERNYYQKTKNKSVDELLEKCIDFSFDIYGKKLSIIDDYSFVHIFNYDENQVIVDRQLIRLANFLPLRLVWAPPEHGSMFAVSSFGRSVRLYRQSLNLKECNGSGITPFEWTMIETSVNSYGIIRDLKFASNFISDDLKLILCSSDGRVIQIIYNNSGENFDREQSRIFPFEDVEENETIGFSSISYSNSTRFQPMIILGADHSLPKNKHKIILLVYNEISDQKKEWIQLEPKNFIDCSVESNSIDIVMNGIDERIHDVSFAPCTHRSYHTVAIAGDKSLYLFALKEIEKLKYNIYNLGIFDQQIQYRAHRVHWHLSGKFLIASCIDGRIRTWKANYLDKFLPVNIIETDDGLNIRSMIIQKLWESKDTANEEFNEIVIGEN